MNARFHSFWPLLLIAVVAISGFASYWFLAPQPTPPTPPAAGPPAPQGTVIYDPDPEHLWNRLDAACQALIKGAEARDPWELDPFLRRDDDYEFSGEAQKAALNVLDEFIAKNGHTLITDPLKRAFLQRDLWTLFESPGLPRWPAKKDPQMELAARVARIIPRLSLTAEEIKKLPNNYAEAVAAKEAWFLPADVWEPQGPWVLLGDEARLPLALTHVQFFGGRSTFFVFLRLPDGREQTLKFLDELRKRTPDPEPPPLHSGTQVALVRQMQLIDDRGKPVTTNVTESLQLRGQGEFELKLNRRAFLAGKPSLKLVGEDDRERAYLLFMGNNAGNGSEKVLNSCFGCHQGKGIDAVLSYRRFKPLHLIPTARPTLIAAQREDVEMWSRAWKGNRYDWGLLQGMTQNSARD
jgi:hypothetical protein